jgi:hypothetical protein
MDTYQVTIKTGYSGYVYTVNTEGGEVNARTMAMYAYHEKHGYRRRDAKITQAVKLDTTTPGVTREEFVGE